MIHSHHDFLHPIIRSIIFDAVSMQTSDIWISWGTNPKVNIKSEMVWNDSHGLDQLLIHDYTAICMSLLNAKEQNKFIYRDEVDFSFEQPDLGRFRGTVHRSQRYGTPIVTLRRIPNKGKDRSPKGQKKFRSIFSSLAGANSGSGRAIGAINRINKSS